MYRTEWCIVCPFVTQTTKNTLQIAVSFLIHELIMVDPFPRDNIKTRPN